MLFSIIFSVFSNFVSSFFNTLFEVVFFFGTIAKKSDKIPKSKKKFSNYLKNKNLTSFLLSPVTEK